MKPPDKRFITLLGGALNPGNALADLLKPPPDSRGNVLANLLKLPPVLPGNALANPSALSPGYSPGSYLTAALTKSLDSGNALRGEAMTSDQYLSHIIAKYSTKAEGAKAQIKIILPTIKLWANKFLVETIYSGSLAKGTAVSLASDADLFISLSSSTPESLADIYTTLYNALSGAGYQVRKQNVSLGVNSGGYKIDFVPGKRQSQYGYDHSLYRNKANTWTKTNVKTHVSHVSKSNRIPEIKLTKIWRELNKLTFPSFYLELAVMDCLSGRSYSDISNNFWEVIGFLAGDFVNRRYNDPANTNNVISDDLSMSERRLIQNAAKIARTKKLWEEIVW